MKKIVLSLSMIVLAFSFNANAQVSITSVATPYTQDFNTLSNDTTFANTFAIGLTGWEISEKGTSAVADQKYKVNNGSRTAGDTYSYGDSTTTERALGTLGSGTNRPSFGVVFQNNTGGIFTGLDVTYKGEQWRSGDTCLACLDSLIFEYSTTATSIGDTTATWNAVSSLMLNTVNLTAPSAGALPGNLPANSTNKTGTISVLVPNGGKILLRWKDVNKASSDDGLAVDDLSVTFTTGGNPKPSISTTTPADDAMLVSPSLTTLTMTFDMPVVAGTGNVTVKNISDATSQTIAVSSTTISGATVTIPGVTLLSGKNYAVNFDSTCYQSGASANAYGIYDNTSWNFSVQPNSIFDFEKNNLTLNILGENTLSFVAKNSATLTLTIFDVQGKRIAQEKVNAQQGENKISLASLSVAKGMYFVQLANSDYKGIVKYEKQ